MLRYGQVEEAELADAGVGVDLPGAVADGGNVGRDLGRGDVAVGFEEGADVGGGRVGLVVGGGFLEGEMEWEAITGGGMGKEGYGLMDVGGEGRWSAMLLYRAS